MLSYKLQKIKEYLKENLKKKFITLSKASFASSILFVEEEVHHTQQSFFCFVNTVCQKERW